MTRALNGLYTHRMTHGHAAALLDATSKPPSHRERWWHTVDLFTGQALNVDDPSLSVHLHHFAITTLHKYMMLMSRPQAVFLFLQNADSAAEWACCRATLPAGGKQGGTGSRGTDVPKAGVLSGNGSPHCHA